MGNKVRRPSLIFVLTVILLASGCAPAVAPVATATPTPPQCSVTVTAFDAGIGMSTILSRLGIDYYNEDPTLLVNGDVEKKSYMPQPGDYIVLESKPAVCTGEYVSARQVHLYEVGATYRDISGFQEEITTTRVLNALQQVCEGVRWDEYGLRFDGDIFGVGNCNYATAVKISRTNGDITCHTYESAKAAYFGATFDLDRTVKWISFLSQGEIVTNTANTPNHCK